MNEILCVLLPGPFVHGDVPSTTIDGASLVDMVARAAPHAHYEGLVASLYARPSMVDHESLLVRARILPLDGASANAPILVCPDDLDLSCAVVFVEVHTDGDTVTWRRFGAERREGDAPDAIDWWPSPGPFSFPLEAYRAWLAAFEDHERDSQLAARG